MAPQIKGRILFLHGYTQSSTIFYAKTSALRKRLLKLGYIPVYINGQLKLTPADFPSTDSLSKFSTVVADDEDDSNYRAWWIRPILNTEPIPVDDGVDTVRRYIEKGEIVEDSETKAKSSDEDHLDVPIVGIVGFSQGACLAGLIARNFNRLFDVKDKIKFVVAYGGFMLQHPTLKLYYQKEDETKDDSFKLLQVIGELDTVVDEKRALTILEPFPTNSEVLRHPGGHFVPNSKLLIDQVVNWMEHAMQDDKSSDKESSKAEKEEDDLDKLMDMMDNLGKA